MFIEQDLLVVNAELPPCDVLNNESLTKAAAAPSAFTGQLYLFETVGTLISILNQVPTQQVTLLRSALAPLLSSLQTSVRTNVTTVEDFAAVFRVHHLILAVGNVGKGFPDLSIRVPVPSGSWVEVFKEATEGILTAAKSMSQFVIIREAVSFFLRYFPLTLLMTDEIIL
jgi:exportin-T